jgi:anti-sigma B factor antagonist
VPPETEQPLRIVAHRDGDTATFTLAGELDPHTAPTLADELDEAIAGGATTVVLQLEELSFIDSSGLRVVISAHRQLDEKGGRLVLRSPSDTVRRLLEITGLLDHIEID